MPYLFPTRTPLTPEQVEQGFDYLLALQTGGGTYAAGRVEATPELAFILLRLAKDIIWPVTAVDGETTDPCADSFVLDEVGCVLLSALRDWARDSATTAVPGIARSIIRFVENVIPNPDDHGDTHATLEAMRDKHLTLAHAVHTPHPVRTAARTTAPPHRVEAHRCGGAPIRCAPSPPGAPPLGWRCAHRCGRRAGVVPTGWRRSGGVARVEAVEAVRFSLT
ncbi:hypothetical protein [Streptomyces lavendofoliae]|uniref:hypothetical protein n=1 Tax=Streptomyces lavendofoliae TaxID=67314 RepID=UPI003D939BE1